jgi:hypothetical protein
LTIRRPLRSLRLLFSDPRWLSGYLAGLGGWALYIAALVFAPISLVQATSAGGIGILAVLVSRAGPVRLSRQESMGTAVALLGLLLLVLSLFGHQGNGTHGRWNDVALWVGGSALAAGLAAGLSWRALAPGAGLGVAAGILFAAGDVATKGALPGGARLAFVPVLLACHGLAFVALQFGFQRGSALATAGVSSVFTNSVPIAAGLVVFREVLPAGPFGALRLVSFLAVVAGAALLSRRGDVSARIASKSVLRSSP